jgi:HEPN domain-containing protein
MNSLTAEWVEKAEDDYASAGREAAVKPRTNYNLVCFLAQQCAEKYLKAYLQEHSVAFPRTHELLVLLKLCLPLDNSFGSLRSLLRGLTLYAVDYRYPGVSANSVMTQTAFQNVTNIRAFIRAKLGLPPA